MPTWTTALPDWERRIVAGESIVPCEPIFPAEAEDALRVFDSLIVADVAGKPTMGEVSRPWVRQFVAALFGAYDRETGRQLIREALLLISKKNGKSTDAAGIMMTLLLRNWRESSELLILAPTVEIANNSFKPAWDMVRNDEELGDLLHVQDHIRTITHRTTRAQLKIVAAENETVSGKKASFVLVDELWLFGKRANADSMLAEATGGLASRPEGMVIYTSTHSDEVPAGVWKSKLTYARGVRDGAIDDPAFLPVLYEYPPEMLKAERWRDESTWGVTNPNLGASVDEEFLRREWKKAEAADNPARATQIFLAKHLNVEVGQGVSGGWVGATLWPKNADPTLDLDSLLKRSEVVIVGIDGGGLDDLLGLAVLGRETGTGKWLHWGHAWCHTIALERRKSEETRLRGFESDGDLTIVDADNDDVDDVEMLVKRIEETGLLAMVGVDSAGIGAIVDRIEALGIKRGDRLFSVKQGGFLTAAISTVERKLRRGDLVHGGSGLMAYAIGNAKPVVGKNSVAMDKAVSGRGKIDPVVALLDAADLMTRNPPARRVDMNDYLDNMVIG